MKTPSWYIPRRTLLQTAGTAIALPVLEAMIRPGARAATPPPRRFLAMHGLVYGYVGRSDVEQKTTIAPWSPRARGQFLPIENNSYLKPFFDKKIDSKITLLTGLTDRVLIGTHDSPVKLVANTYPVAMRRGGCVVLTATPGPTNSVGPPPQPDPYNGATADQIAASHLGKLTPIPYLSLGIINIGGNPKFTMSNKSANEPIPSDRDPKTVFNRLFSGYDPAASLDDVQRRARYRKSVLDGVRAEASSLKARLGRSDKQKLDGYLESVSSLERVIAKAGATVPVGITAPGAASSYANRELVQKAMQDLIVQAFVTDRTRVVAFSCQYPGSWLRFRGAGQEGMDYSLYRQFNGTPFSGDHHSMSHYDQGLNGGAPTAEITAMKKDWMEIFAHWALEMYADLLAKLDSYMDADGASTVLDNLVGVWGGDNADSARHAFMSMACVLGGRGGNTGSAWRIRSGRHIRFADYGAGARSERSWKDLLWGMLNIVGVPDLKSFGYATNPLDLDLR